MATTSVSPATRTGVSRSVRVPSPSSPSIFHPELHTVPSSRSARLWSTPAALVPEPDDALLREDLRFAMPPQPGLFVGREEILGYWAPGFDQEGFGQVRTWFEDFWTDALDAFKRAAEADEGRTT